eukprot:1891853-Rhodomonas_salina.1
MAPEAFDPEQFGGVTSKTDIWSVGGCLLHMVSGAAPFASVPMAQIITRVLTQRRGPEPLPPASPFTGILRRCF